jgi:hypothetical protein
MKGYMGKMQSSRDKRYLPQIQQSVYSLCRGVEIPVSERALRFPWKQSNESKVFYEFESKQSCSNYPVGKERIVVQYHDDGCDTVPPGGLCIFNSALLRTPTQEETSLA